MMTCTKDHSFKFKLDGKTLVYQLIQYPEVLICNMVPTQFLRAKNNETIMTFQKIQNRALRKLTLIKSIMTISISCEYKECKILKFPNTLKSSKPSLFYVPNLTQPRTQCASFSYFSCQRQAHTLPDQQFTVL